LLLSSLNHTWLLLNERFALIVLSKAVIGQVKNQR
jgi:hypothetical protein